MSPIPMLYNIPVAKLPLEYLHHHNPHLTTLVKRTAIHTITEPRSHKPMKPIHTDDAITIIAISLVVLFFFTLSCGCCYRKHRATRDLVQQQYICIMNIQPEPICAEDENSQSGDREMGKKPSKPTYRDLATRRLAIVPTRKAVISQGLTINETTTLL